jgi:hypothetical protein
MLCGEMSTRPAHELTKFPPSAAQPQPDDPVQPLPAYNRLLYKKQLYAGNSLDYLACRFIESDVRSIDSKNYYKLTGGASNFATSYV